VPLVLQYGYLELFVILWVFFLNLLQCLFLVNILNDKIFLSGLDETRIYGAYPLCLELIFDHLQTEEYIHMSLCNRIPVYTKTFHL